MVNTPVQRLELAIEVLVRALSTIAGTAEHTSDPRVMRSIALQALRDADRIVDLPAPDGGDR
jgi:hypothetical protein